jgi:hypothetical protein
MPEKPTKSRVSPEVARQWLRRAEELGETAGDISRSDGYDMRTVRRHLEEMKHDRDVRQAKQTVFAQALQKHFEDLCAFSDKLRHEISTETPRPISKVYLSDPLFSSLKQHQPRSGLWRTVENWNQTIPEYEASRSSLRAKIELAIAPAEFTRNDGTRLKIMLSEGAVDAIMFHLKSVTSGDTGITGCKYELDKQPDRTYTVQLGAYTIAANLDSSASNLVEAAFKSIIEKAMHWREYASYKVKLLEINRLRQKIYDELTRIVLKRVVHGDCEYCPF